MRKTLLPPPTPPRLVKFLDVFLGALRNCKQCVAQRQRIAFHATQVQPKGGIHGRNELWSFPTTVPFKLMTFRDRLVTVMTQAGLEYNTVLEASWPPKIEFS